MEIKEFKKYCFSLSNFDGNDIDNFEFMTDEEIDNFQSEIERDTGNHCGWDQIRAIMTLKKKIADIEEKAWKYDQLCK
jgi:predicted class III extradiol MEMO1 family dioxygenase